MKKLAFYVLPAIFVLLAVLSACAKPPTEEMNRANDAVLRAESDADAVKYAGNTLLRARDALTRMQSEADAKRYDAAKISADEAIKIADQAIAEGKANSSRAKDEATNLINSLSGPLAETTSALDAARQYKNLDLNFDALGGELDSAYLLYDHARQNLAANNYKEAITDGQGVRSSLADINSRLTASAQVISRKQ